MRIPIVDVVLELCCQLMDLVGLAGERRHVRHSEKHVCGGRAASEKPRHVFREAGLHHQFRFAPSHTGLIYEVLPVIGLANRCSDCSELDYPSRALAG